MPDGDAEVTLRLYPQIGQNAGDQGFDGLTLPKYVRAGQAPAGKVRLQGLNQAPLGFRGEILLDGGRPRPRFDGGAAPLLDMLQVEQRAERFGAPAAVRERDKLDSRPGCESHRAVRSPEIDSDRGAISTHHWKLYPGTEMPVLFPCDNRDSHAHRLADRPDLGLFSGAPRLLCRDAPVVGGL